MRLLPTLLLICIILEKPDNGIKFGKLYALRSKENILKFGSSVLITNVISKWYMKLSWIIFVYFKKIIRLSIVYYLLFTLSH